MGSFNRIILMGNLGNAPDVRTAGNSRVAGFSLATTTVWNKDGAKQERTTWHRIVAWGKLADVVESSLGKGSPVLVEGALEGREYTDKEGQKQRIFEVRASNLQLVEKKADRQARTGRPGGGGANYSDRGDYHTTELSDSEVPF